MSILNQISRYLNAAEPLGLIVAMPVATASIKPHDKARREEPMLQPGSSPDGAGDLAGGNTPMEPMPPFLAASQDSDVPTVATLVAGPGQVHGPAAKPLVATSDALPGAA